MSRHRTVPLPLVGDDLTAAVTTGRVIFLYIRMHTSVPHDARTGVGSGPALLCETWPHRDRGSGHVRNMR